MRRMYPTLVSITLLLSAGLSTAIAQQVDHQKTDSERYQAKRVATDDAARGPTVKEALASKLRLTNDGAIELAKLMQEKTDRAEIRQLTQTIARDHQVLNRELKRLTSDARWAKDKAGQKTSTDHTSTDAARVPPQLCQVAEKAMTRSTEMTREMLNRYDGQDLNMAYLSHQLVAHTMLIAELEAIQAAGPEPLHDVAEQALGKVRKHFQRAKKLAKRFEDEADRAVNN